MNLPNQYSWLEREEAPKMIVEGLKLYGIAEIHGVKNNPEIMRWAEVLGIADIVPNDEQAWCALSHSYVAHMAGKDLFPLKRYDLIRALAWSVWGSSIPVGQEMLGDTLVFGRTGGGHVGLYIGEDVKCFHVLGGNERDMYSIMRLEKDRLKCCRRPVYKTGVPPNVRKVYLKPDGLVSKNEG